MQCGMVSSGRLRRAKCPICGSKDKNVANVSNAMDQPAIKIMACNQCGHITMFGVSALAIADMITGGINNMRKVEHYEEIVRCQHENNHPE